jgi:hypothetical protein
MGDKMRMAFLAGICLFPRVAAAEVDPDQINRALRIPLLIGLGLMTVGGVLWLIGKLVQKLASKFDRESSGR